jgi:2'-5' RNA ligase
MLSKYFVGVTFSSGNTLSRKIQGFRQRFDPKYNQHATPHLSLLAPFETESKHRENLIDALSDEMESFFFGDDMAPKIGFQGLGVYRHKRQSILYLNPLFQDNLKYCMESVQELCESFIPSQVSYKQNARQFLPLGYFNNEEQLHRVMDHAKSEFLNNSELFITGISLFEKKYGVWTVAEELINFDTADKFLQLQHASI